MALGGSGGDGLLADAAELILTLADVGGDADDRRVVVLAQPGHVDGGVEATRVGEGDGSHGRGGNGMNAYGGATHSSHIIMRRQGPGGGPGRPGRRAPFLSSVSRRLATRSRAASDRQKIG